MKKKTDAMIAYDYLAELYKEVEETDAKELAEKCGVSELFMQTHKKTTLQDIHKIRELIAHSF